MADHRTWPAAAAWAPAARPRAGLVAIAALAVGLLATALQQRLPLSLTWALLDEVTHAALAVIVAAWLLPAWGVRPLVVAALAATAIDADHIVAAGSVSVERLMSLGARPISHSLPAAVALGGLVAAVAGRRNGVAVAIGVLSHVLWDSIGPPGVPLLVVDANRHVVLPAAVVMAGLAGLAGLSVAVTRLDTHLDTHRDTRLARLRRLGWPAWIAAGVLLGGVVRLPLLGRDSGIYDAGYFRAVMQAGAADLPSAYTQVSPDYPPLTMLIFGLTGALTRWCCAPDLAPTATPTIVAAKLPEVIASLALAAIIGLAVARRSVGLAGLAAAAYALNPGVVYVSAFWTQAEALWVLPIVLGLLALERQRFVLGWVAFAAAVLTKPQAAAFVPLLLVATWRTAPRSAWAWLAGPAAALGLALAVSAPWWLTGHAGDVAQVYLGLSGADAYVSGSAYSLWYLWLLGHTHKVPADTPLLGSLTYQQAGWLLFAGLLAWVVWQARRRRQPPSLFLSAATLWLGLAVLLTQTHERYVHPVLPLLLLAPELYAARSRLWLVWTAVTLAYAYNLITVLPFAGFPGPSLIAAPDGGTRVLVLRALSLVAAGTFLASLVVLAVRLRRPAGGDEGRKEAAWAFAR